MIYHLLLLLMARALASATAAPLVRLVANDSSPVPTAATTTASSSSSSSSSSSDTDRSTMIIIVACVVGAFAVIVVIAILRTRRQNKTTATNNDDPSTPIDTAFHPYAESAKTDAAAPVRKSYAIHRPSQAYTERTTNESVARESVVVIQRHDSTDSRSSGPFLRQDTTDSRTSGMFVRQDTSASDDDVAMLESYAHARSYDFDHTFLSAVTFEDDSTRSLDVDALRRSATLDDDVDTYNPSDTMLTTSSIASYWNQSEDDNGSFVDASEPPKYAVV